MSRSWYRGSAVLHPSRARNLWIDLWTAVSPCGAPGVLLRWLREGSLSPVRPPAELHAAGRCKEEQTRSQTRTWAAVWRGRGGPSASRQREELCNKLGWTPGSKRDALSSLKAGSAVTAKCDFFTVCRKPAARNKRTAGQVHFHYSVICLGRQTGCCIDSCNHGWFVLACCFTLFVSRGLLVTKRRGFNFSVVLSGADLH